jgi:hypothetical protein
MGLGFDAYAAAVSFALKELVQRRVYMLVVLEPDSGQVWLYPAMRNWQVEQQSRSGGTLV